MIGTAVNATASSPPLRMQVRPSVTADLPLILNSWQKNWRKSARCKHLDNAQYEPYFDAMVRRGVLLEPDTAILIGASEHDPDWIWGWLCYTPGLVPTLHYAWTRQHIEGRPRPVEIRDRGLFRTLVSAAGVAGEAAYTFRPSDSGIERGLLDAAKAADVIASFRPIEEFLERRRGR